MRWGGGEWRGGVAFFAFDALSLGVADVRMHANAGWSAFHFRASFGHLRSAVDQERQRRSAGGHAVQLVTAFGCVHLAIGGALGLGIVGEEGHRFCLSFAVGSLDAHAISVLQVSWLAEAANDAVAGAGRSRVWFGARRWASGTARVEFFVLTAFVWWHHHERFRLWHGGAFAGHYAFSVGRSEVSLLAGATADADTRADWVGVLAGAVASLAVTVFLVGVADHGRHHHGFFGRHATVLRFHAHAFLVFQVAGFAEASGDAFLGAHSRMRLGAGRWAGRAAAEENLVLGALRHFRRVGEEHGGFRGSGDLVVDFEVRCIAVFFRDAFAVDVLQESSMTETTADTLHGTHFGFFRISAVRLAGGTTG